METIKVNMSPNPLDVQTIHASQNDGEAREWGFALHNNGDAIDSSSISDQLVFKAYEGGTEEILPTNGSVPTTAPFLGDIRYPQGLLTDQEFTYRQSPTESDGLAKITDIKGNTLVWNQLVQNGNFADGVGQWSTGGANTLSVTDGVCKIQSTNTSTNNHHIVFPDPSIFQNNHTYLVGVSARAYGNYIGGNLYLAQQTNIIGIGTLIEVMSSSWQRGWLLFNRNDMTLTNNKRLALGGLSTVTTDDYFEVKDIVAFDLTQMGLDISNPSYFTSLFPLSYYSYNQGSLLSFNGSGIKTTGKNLLPPSTEFSSVADITISAVNGIYTLNGTPSTYRQAIATNSFVLEPGTYRFSRKSDIANNNVSVQLRSVDGLTTYAIALNEVGAEFTLTERTEIKLRIAVNENAGTLNNFIIRPMLEFGSVATDFEPYTESTLSLPIAEHFPNGMRRAGNAYDELTNSKATTRVKQIIFDGSSDENWNIIVSAHRAYITITDIDTSTPDAEIGNIMSNMYVAGAYSRGAIENIITTRYGIAQINVFDSVNIASSSTTATWIAYLQEHPLIVNYALATPTETSFTTASLVTENAEIPLSNEDGVLIGKCTEQLSENPGFIDAKIKLTDSDGTCYSNKIQLHVERSPQ